MLLTRPEAAQIMGVSMRKTDSLIAEGKLPVVRIGASVRISQKSLAEFIESMETTSPYKNK